VAIDACLFYSYEIGSQDDKLQPNVWLPEETLPGFRDFTQKFYWECHKVALSILKAMALGIGLDNLDFFEQFHSGNNCQLRLLHYPPIPAAEIEQRRAERMPAHTDWSTITMLFQDDCGGLEVEDPHQAGMFIPATPVPGACVMNVGDMLMRWSNGKPGDVVVREVADNLR
jgi:isopenicillin N synthase-like dioxygenase